MTRISVPAGVSVMMLVENRGRYLLVQEAKPERDNPWFIPCGGVEPGESIVDAAKRETLEETGLLVEPRHLLRIEHIIPHGQDKRCPSLELWHFVIVAEATGGALKTIGDEHSLQARWFRPEQLDGLDLRHRHLVVELIQMHRQGTPLLPVEAYVAREQTNPAIIAPAARVGVRRLPERYWTTPIRRTVALLSIAIAIILGILYLINANR